MAGWHQNIIVLFTAPNWCQPCRRFEPHWNAASDKAEDVEHLFVKVDMGESPEDTGEHWASKRFNILGVPAIKAFRQGNEPVDVQARTAVALLKELNNV